MNVCPPLPPPGGVEGGVSGFLASLFIEMAVAPKGFVKSVWELESGDDFDTGVDGELTDVAGVVELEENFELMLDIHEFRRPTEVALGSF